jgi:hypothetical protein
MEIHDPPDHTRYYPSAAGRIEFLSFSPATSLQRLNFRVAVLNRPMSLNRMSEVRSGVVLDSE